MALVEKLLPVGVKLCNWVKLSGMRLILKYERRVQTERTVPTKKSVLRRYLNVAVLLKFDTTMKKNKEIAPKERSPFSTLGTEPKIAKERAGAKKVERPKTINIKRIGRLKGV